ncbi:hypothetical protein [uncultured Sphingomonas sp.]|uniref:hypothetical protein n=1 Tax=uncultured Sphingomonas sp. TaxID=158754 RepID=UPI0025D57972|nr:hypothetical protein [uncultured Sphingomonas sp.]
MQGLDDPAQARFAWRRFRRILAIMTLIGIVAAFLAVHLLGRAYGELGWIATLATFGGVIGSIAMAGALMGLAFMSSGTGHDEVADAAGLDTTTGRAPRKDVGP